MADDPVKSSLFPGRRRGIPDEKDTYAYKEHPAKAARKAKAAQDAEQKKLFQSWYARAGDIIRDHNVKGECPLCGRMVGKGISGHVFAHVRAGEADQWQPTSKSKIESITTISTDPI